MLINVNNVDIFYKKQGSGSAVLLIHGNGEDHHIFDDLATELAKTYTVYQLDTRGHGQSSPVEKLSYEDMAQDMAAFIQQLNIDKPLLIGFSDGAISGMLVEINNPGLLGKLVLCGANTHPSGLRWNCRLGIRLMYAIKRDDKTRLMLQEPDIKDEQLKRISIPVYVLAGNKDIVNASHTKHIAKCISGSSLKILDGHSHYSYVINHNVLLDALGDFI